VPGHGHPDEEAPRLESRGQNPKLGPPDLGFPTAGIGMSLQCTEGEQARRTGYSHHPVCDTLAAPCRLGSREALSLRFLSLSGSPRYAGLAFASVSIALGSGAGVSPSYPAPTQSRSSRHTSTIRPALIIRCFQPPVTRDMCDERGDKSPPSLLRPSDKIIVPARRPSLVALIS